MFYTNCKLVTDENGSFLHVKIKSEPISNNYDYQEGEEEEDDEGTEFPVSNLNPTMICS